MSTDIEDLIPTTYEILPEVLEDSYYIGECKDICCTDVKCPNCIYYRTSNWDKRRVLRTVKGLPIKWDILSKYMSELCWGDLSITNKHEYTHLCRQLSRKYHTNYGNVELNYAYKRLIRERLIKDNTVDYRNSLVEYCIQGKKVRKISGVTVATVLTSGEKGFVGGDSGCQWDCYYCPNEPGMPRSYLKKEPAVARADANDFDAYKQMIDRFTILTGLGGYPDKVEIIVEGGTIASYKKDYLIEFIRDLYYACNVYYIPSGERRTERYELSKEMKINETSMCRVIGLTLETRPDCINEEEIKFFRSVGCTRIQIGVQHIEDDILKKINRKCYIKDTITAIRMLKDCGFKVDIHIMPDLPGSSPEKDKKMFQRILDDHELQVDDWKIYPCQTVTFSKLLEDFNKTMTDFKNYLSSNDINFDDDNVTNQILEEYYDDFILENDENNDYYIPYTHDFKKDRNLDTSNIRKLIDVCKYVKRQIHPLELTD
jgi:histone acetyltransferase (RNA polymerase elongator complex component)